MENADLQLKAGRIYEAKKPALVGSYAQVNDRQIVWISPDGSRVQYDSPSVAFGRRRPIVTAAKFLEWAARDVTEEMPPEDWRTTLPPKPSTKKAFKPG